MHRAIVLILLGAIGSQAAGQTVDVAVDRGPHYVGDAFRVRVVARGFDEQPTCEPEQAAGGPGGLTLSFDGVGERSHTSMRVINNTVTRQTSTTYIFNYRAVADKKGTYAVPAFTIEHDKVVRKTREVEVLVAEVELDGEMRIEVVLPEGPIFPGQQAPVTVRWWYAGNLENVQGLSVRVPLFDQFEYEDEPIQRGDSALPIETRQGKVRLRAQVEQKLLDGREWVVLSATRRLRARQPGEYEIEAPSVNISQVTRWVRDFFGRQPAAVVRKRAVGEPGRLVIRPVPLAEAPPGFAGAVGRGYGIDVTADRTVVQAGDPVKLTITLRGEGDLQSASLPPMSGKAALDPAQFRVGDGEIPGTMLEDGKQFHVVARVLHENVSEIPPISYAWFDPDEQQFKTTQSKPIALRVTPAQMVTAADVVGAAIDPAPAPEQPRPDTQTVRTLDLTGADLSIVTSPAVLLASEDQRFGGPTAMIVIYAVSLMLAPLALWRRRVADVDPAVVQRRRLIREQSRVIARAGKLGPTQAATHIAGALRQLAPCADSDDRAAIDRLIARCDTVAFAPGDSPDASLEDSIRTESAQLAQKLARQVP